MSLCSLHRIVNDLCEVQILHLLTAAAFCGGSIENLSASLSYSVVYVLYPPHKTRYNRLWTCDPTVLYTAIHLAFQSPVVKSCTTRFSIKKLYILPAQCVYVLCVGIVNREWVLFINTDWITACITEAECVYCAVRIDSLENVSILSFLDAATLTEVSWSGYPDWGFLDAATLTEVS